MTSDFDLLSALFREEFDKRGRSLYRPTKKTHIYHALNDSRNVDEADVRGAVDHAVDFAQTLFSGPEVEGRGALSSGGKPLTALTTMPKIISLFP